MRESERAESDQNESVIEREGGTMGKRADRVREIERKRSWRAFSMRGVVTKKDVIAIARAFGVWKAVRVVCSREQTALGTLMS